MTLRKQMASAKQAKSLGFDINTIQTNNGMDRWWVEELNLSASSKTKLLELIIEKLSKGLNP